MVKVQMEKWVLLSVGFGYVWLFHQAVREKLFLNEFRDKLRDVFCQEWYTVFKLVCCLRCLKASKAV